MVKSVLHLGSNLGNKKENIEKAISFIKKEVGEVLLQSPYYKTAPWGVKNQPYFINIALVVLTTLLPDELLRTTQSIEGNIGRLRKQRWSARHIDIDIIFYDDWRIDFPELIIPHPHIQERNFVLYPLSDIIPDMIHPTIKKSILQLKELCRDESEVTIQTFPTTIC